MDDIDRFLSEDLGEEGDITSKSLFTSEEGVAEIIAKEECILAGLDEIEIVFNKIGAVVELKANNGDFVKKNTIIAKIKGPVRSILEGERLSLNFLGRMSGIASETKRLVDICKSINPNITIAATRKTTPGFRKYEKKAVLIGGGETHRFGLFDAVLIKDNHLKIIGSVEDALIKIKNKLNDKIIEIEVENEKDALTAAKMNADVIMLDNFTPINAEKVARKIRQLNPNILIEISGGITKKNIENYATFADRISLGYLTHTIRNIDFSLKIR
jgi:nicotinate-nucleotide pyrophosphorylase (carboxylating)